MLEEINRREFLSIASLGGLGASMLPTSLLSSCGATTTSDKLGKIALQLYTLRNEITKDSVGTLKRLAEIGFEGSDAYHVFPVERIAGAAPFDGLDEAGTEQHSTERFQFDLPVWRRIDVGIHRPMTQHDAVQLL